MIRYINKADCQVYNNGQDMDISDPWGYNMNTYRMCAAEISLCVDKIIEKLTNK